MFSWPTSILKDKAYIGGKSILNSGGNLVDFMMKSGITQSAALIEIKTPATNLLGSKYRDDVYNTSSELSGSIMQMLNYKHTLEKEYVSLAGNTENAFKAFNPQCVVIIGNALKELTDDKKLNLLSYIGINFLMYQLLLLMNYSKKRNNWLIC